MSESLSKNCAECGHPVCLCWQYRVSLDTRAYFRKVFAEFKEGAPCEGCAGKGVLETEIPMDRQNRESLSDELRAYLIKTLGDAPTIVTVVETTVCSKCKGNGRVPKQAEAA